MATYTLDLTGAPLNFASVGGLDTSISNGVSLQRTGYIETVDSSGNRKVNVMNDGASFSDAAQGLTDLENAGHKFIV